jgi:hypothetical protein
MTALLVKIAPWLLLIGVAWFGGCQYAQGRALAGELGRLGRVRDSLANVARGRDTLYLTQVDTLRLVRTKTDSIVATIITTDTVIHRDTVVQLIARERDACDAVIATCEARVADRDRQIANLDSLLKTQQKRHGGDWKTKLGLLLGGAAAGVLIAK